MRLRILFAIVVATALAGCSDSSTATSAPPRLRPEGPLLTLECRSGYHVATRADGTKYCAPDENPDALSSRPTYRP